MKLESPSSAGRAGGKRLALAIAFLLTVVPGVSLVPAAGATGGEYIIISGGPALRQWEDYRIPEDQHDRWWGNFVRTARIRMDELRAEHGDALLLTWLVYKPGYERRASEEGRPLLDFIRSVSARCGARLVWVNSGYDVISYLNSGRDRSSTKISGLEYFGHSNKYCWVLDYSSFILGASKAWIHETDFPKIGRGIFTSDPHIKSWGCHTAESMCAAWFRATDTRMWGAFGKTDYSESWKNQLPHISTPGGRWQR